MTPNKSHVAGLELAKEALANWPVTGLTSAKNALDQLIEEAQSAPEPVQGEAVAWILRVGGYQDVLVEDYKRVLSEQEHFIGRGRTADIIPLYTEAAKPDAELVELLRDVREWASKANDLVLYPVASTMTCRAAVEAETLVIDLTGLQNRIDAKLASLK